MANVTPYRRPTKIYKVTESFADGKKVLRFFYYAPNAQQAIAKHAQRMSDGVLGVRAEFICDGEHIRP